MIADHEPGDAVTFQDAELRPGRLITGVFEHGGAVVYDLHAKGEPRPIGITATHPVWSEERRDWVKAQDLILGERLLALDGSSPVVLAVSMRPQSETVYNIEVDGEHCYRVGRQGLLVHNASVLQLAKNWAADVKSDLNQYGQSAAIPTAKAAVARYKPTGATARGDSTTPPPTVFHPLLDCVITALMNLPAPPCNNPIGVCAEVKAVNQLLLNLQAQGTTPQLSDIEVATVAVNNGQPVAACPNCVQILAGVDITTG